MNHIRFDAPLYTIDQYIILRLRFITELWILLCGSGFHVDSETTPEMVHPSQVHRLSKLDSPSEPQCTAFFTSAVILASSVAVNLVSAY